MVDSTDYSETYLRDRQTVERENSAGARLLKEYQSGALENVPQPVVQEQPTEQPVEEKGFVGKAVDTATFLSRPFGFMSSFGLAPLAHDYESETFIGKTVEGIAVGAKAALDELLPAYGKVPDHASQVREKYFPDVPDALKPSVDIAISIFSDPAMLAFPFSKSLRKGLQISAAQKDGSGPFKHALEEFVSIVPMKEQELSELKLLAKQADEGDVDAAKEIAIRASRMSETERITTGLKLQDPKVEKTLVKTLGDPNKNPVSIGKTAKQVLTLEDTDLPKHSINLNLSRINTPEDVQQIIHKVSLSNKGQLKKVKGFQSQKETERLANMLNMTVDTLLSRRASDFTPAEALASRQLLVASAEKLQTLAKVVTDPNSGDIDKITFLKALTTHKAIREQVTGITAEAGRLLNQFNIQAKSTKGKLKHIDTLLANMGGDATKISDIAEMMSGMDGFRQIDTMADQLWKAKVGDVVLEAWINGLLSGPQTHVVNTLSNSLVAVWQVPERILASGFSKFLNSGDDGVRFLEAKAQAYGLVRGMEDGIRSAVNELKGVPDDFAGKMELPRRKAITSEALELSGNTGRAVDLLGSAIRSPGLALQTEDAFFKAIGYRMELQARAYRQAVAEGLSGEGMARRISEMVSNPPEDIHLAAVDASHYQTFTRELNGFGKDIQNFVNKYPAMKVIMPFMRTPGNIAKFAVERTPIAPILKEVRADMRVGGAKRDLALSRIALGSSVMAMTSMWAAEGKITGSGPVDTQSRNALYLTGWQPNSIKIGDEWYSFGRLEPIGTLLGVAADFTEISGEMDTMEADELATTIVASIAKNVTSKTFLSGLTETINAFSDPERYGQRYIERLATSLVPATTFLAQTERAVDPTLRVTDGIFEKIRSRIPGYSSDLPARKNIFAEPIVLNGGLGPDIMSPIYTSKLEDTPLSKSIEENDISFTMPVKVVNGVELTPVQYNRLIELTAEKLDPEDLTSMTLKDAWTDLVTNEQDYIELGTDGRKYLIENLIRTYKEIGRLKLINEDRELFGMIEKKAQEKERMFTPVIQ